MNVINNRNTQLIKGKMILICRTASYCWSGHWRLEVLLSRTPTQLRSHARHIHETEPKLVSQVGSILFFPPVHSNIYDGDGMGRVMSDGISSGPLLYFAYLVNRLNSVSSYWCSVAAAISNKLCGRRFLKEKCNGHVCSE